MENRIFYHSTNRKLATNKISGFKKKVTFKKALFMGQAPDKGLFMPTVIPELSKEEILMRRSKHSNLYFALLIFSELYYRSYQNLPP